MDDNDDEFHRCEECGKEIKTKRAMLAHLDRHVSVSASCRTCHRSFNSLAALKYHFVEFCGKRKVQCPQCKVYMPSTCFNSHVEAHTRNNCRHCPALFTNRKNLVTHMADVHNVVILADAAFPCSVPGCDRHFVKRSTLFHHQQMRHAAEGVFVCLKCGTYVEGKKAFDSHVAVHKKWTCEQCKESFTRRQQYLVHKMRHDQKRYRCITCNESFPTKLRVLEHRNLGHEVAGLSERGICPECGEKFYSSHELKQHATTHKAAAVSCDECGKVFPNQRALSYHSWNTHESEAAQNEGKSDDNPSMPDGQICEQCGKHFTTPSLLAKHLNYFHREKKFECSRCQYRTKYEVNLNRHVAAVHSPQPQQYVCDQCGASFKALSNLKDHYLFVHSDERSFKCDKCGKSFKRRNDLNRHLRSHSDQRGYVCHCKQAYKFIAHLRRHQKAVHKDASGKYEKLNPKEKNSESNLNEVPFDSVPTVNPSPQEPLTQTDAPFPPPSYSDLNFAESAETQANLQLSFPIPLSQFALVDQVENFMGITNGVQPVLLSQLEHDVFVNGVPNQSGQTTSLMPLEHQDSVMISFNVAKAEGLIVNGCNEMNTNCGTDEGMVSHSEMATMTDYMNHQLGLDGAQDVPWSGELEENLTLSVFH